MLHRQGVCFTGKANLNGSLVTRDVMERLVRSQGGIHYETYSQQIDILVASRTDTNKATLARLHGKQVITYEQFWDMLGISSIPELHELIEDDDAYHSAVKKAFLREQEEAQERVQAKRDEFAQRQAELDAAAAAIPGWGSF